MKFFRLDSDLPYWDPTSECLRQLGHKGFTTWIMLYALIAREYDGREEWLTISTEKLRKSAKVSAKNCHFFVEKLSHIYEFSFTYLPENRQKNGKDLAVFYDRFFKKQKKFRRAGDGKFNGDGDSKCAVTGGETKSGEWRVENNRKGFANPQAGNQPVDNPAPPPPRKGASRYSDADMKTALAMMAYVKRHNPTALKIDQASKEAWANEFRLMREVDERQPTDIVNALKFVFAHEPWMHTIQSPAGLRQRWDDIAADHKYRAETGYGG